MFFDELVRRWNALRGRSDRARKIVGIYAQARGGTNLIATALHYHPRLFAVNEHQFDYRRPLASIWREGSVYRSDGVQDKQIEQIVAVIYNKMQEFAPQLWDPRGSFPEGSQFLFYLRNPVRVHLSREAFRRSHKPRRIELADTRENFIAMLGETREILAAYETLRPRYQCLLLSHEYFCCEHEPALHRMHEFLGVEPLPPCSPRAFLRRCGKCRRDYVTVEIGGQSWLACPRHRRPVMGCGRFNPLRAVDRDGVRDDAWKKAPGITWMMADLRKQLGDGLADYFWNGPYSENLPLAGERHTPASNRSVPRAA